METFKVYATEPRFGAQIGKIELRVHSPSKCGGRNCPFHNPSDHKMRKWPMNVRLDNRSLVERLCPHGVGHPDPDSVAFFERQGITYMNVHGCDSCCDERNVSE